MSFYVPSGLFKLSCSVTVKAFTQQLHRSSIVYYRPIYYLGYMTLVGVNAYTLETNIANIKAKKSSRIV